MPIFLEKRQRDILKEIYHSEDYLSFDTGGLTNRLKNNPETEHDIHYLSRHGYLKIKSTYIGGGILIKLSNKGINYADPHSFQSKLRRKKIINEVYNSDKRDDLFFPDNFSDQVKSDAYRLYHDIEYLIEKGIFENDHREGGAPPYFAAVKLTDYAKERMETKKERLIFGTLRLILKSIPVVGKFF